MSAMFIIKKYVKNSKKIWNLINLTSLDHIRTQKVSYVNPLVLYGGSVTAARINFFADLFEFVQVNI